MRHMNGQIGGNLKKTLYYLRRNGVGSTIHAVLERMEKKEPYFYQAPGAEVLAAQRKRQWTETPLFSIVVPAYRTPENYLRELLESVLEQTYGNWELILADATEGDSVKTVAASYGDDRICYYHLTENGGISENTNQALQYAKGDYIGLLDHDDVLTPDALYEMAQQIAGREEKPLILYSDEDKCNQDGTVYYEPHYKEKFNLDLILSNNYICHFLVAEKTLMKNTGFRREYDGAQDYDLVLRMVEQVLEKEACIVHIPKVLYHWRCHTGSTAANPQSKMYAYEAGKRAVQDFAKRRGWNAEAVDLKHLGFYSLRYVPDILAVRQDVGAVGGRLLGRKGVLGGLAGKLRIVGGMYDEDGNCPYEGLPAGYSGYMHKAVLLQEAAALDIRLLRLRPEYFGIFEEVTGVAYQAREDGSFDSSVLPYQADIKALNLRLGKALSQKGCRMVWNPRWSRQI